MISRVLNTVNPHIDPPAGVGYTFKPGDTNSILFEQFLTWRDNILACALPTEEPGMSMAGNIRTKEKCPKCRGRFMDTGKALVCSTCLTTPTRYYLDVYWHGRIRIYSDTDGRPLSSYELAHRVLTEIRQKIDHKTFDPKDYVSVDTKALYFDRNITAWLARQEKRVRKNEIAPSYFEKIKHYVDRYFIPYFESKDVREIRTSHIEDFQMHLPETLGLKTTKNIMAVLQKYFNDLCNRDEIKIKPKFPRITLPEPHMHWADEALQEAIFEKIPERHRPIFLFLKETGCRPGEARALWKEDVNVTDKWVVIRRSFSGDVYRETTKGKRERTIPIEAGVVRMVKALPVIKGFLFLDEFGKPYTRCHLWRIYNRAKKDAGIDADLTLYEWGRHSWATQAAIRNVSGAAIGANLGHTDPRVTAKYTHMNVEGLRLALSKKNGAKVYRYVPNMSPGKNESHKKQAVKTQKPGFDSP